MNTTLNITSLVFTMPARNSTVTYVDVPMHAISPTEIFIILSLFVLLSYWYIKVHRDKEKYSAWKNPNGRIINLYYKVKLFFWLYVAIIIILGLIQTFYMRG